MVQEEQRIRSGSAEDVRSERIERVKELERARQEGAEAMELRCKTIMQAMIDAVFPMKADNPLIKATDEEIRAYIRRKREEFEPRLRSIQEAKAKERERNQTIYRGEKGIPE